MDQFSDLYVKFFYQKSLNFSLLRLQEIYFFIIKSLQRNLQIITLEGLKTLLSKVFRGADAFCSADKAMRQLGVLSLLLQLDKYNFKRNSQTALAGRMHNEHNNSPPPWSLSLVHLSLHNAAVPACAHVSLFSCKPLGGSPPSALQSRCIEKPFGPHFYRGNTDPPILSSFLFAPHM